MEMVDASLVLDAIVTVSIAAGVFFAIAELRDMKRDRRIQVLLQVNDHIGTMEFMDPCMKILRSNATDAKELEKQVSNTGLHMVASYFEEVAALATEGDFEKRALTVYFPYYLLWKKMKPWIVAERIAFDLPPMYAAMEKLAKWQEQQEDFGYSDYIPKAR
jgi:ATP-dependent Clp protease adapter protein ClpS